MSLPQPQAAALASLRGVWRADALTCAVQGPVVPSGHAALDAELPGGGWPTAELIDLLQPACAQHEWRLLLPVLQVLSLVEQGAQPTSPQKTPSRKRSRTQTPAHSPAPLVLVLVGAPHLPHLAALAGDRKSTRLNSSHH